MSTFELVVKILASLTALYMCFSPTHVIYQIYRHKTTGHMPILPLVSQWSYNHIWMLYGYASHEYFPLFVTYAVGSAVSIVYLAIYFFYSSEQQARVGKLVVFAFLTNAIVTMYLVIGTSTGSSEAVTQIIGCIGIACGLVLYASPFATISLVLRTKNAVSIPIGMVLVGMISNSVWILYGFLIHDAIIIIPTVICASLGVAQLILYGVYHPTRSLLKAVMLPDHLVIDFVTGPTNTTLDNEREFQLQHLETPKYEEISSPLPIVVHL